MSEYIITGKQLEWLGVPDIFTECEIVRCCECKHAEKGLWCRSFGQFGDLPAVKPDDFCSRGERRQDD